VTNEELQAMLSAAYGGQVNKANMGLNADPRSEWESYKYNQENQGRTAGDVEPKSMGWGEYAQEWYDRLIGTPLKGMAGAGDALLGKSNPDLESFEKNVLDALSLYAGPSVAKSAFGKLPSQTTLNIFGGVGAKEAPLRMKEIAEKALSAGKDPDEVLKYTGWKPGMEGKMRFEIDDRAMKFTPEAQASFTEQKGMQGLFKAGDDLREGVPLPKAIDHPDLFKQYPELSNVTLKADHPKGGGASFDENTMTIHVPKEGTMLGQDNSYLSSITHEIQHWVQKKEGFARGGSPEMFSVPIKREISTYDRDLKMIDDKIQHYKEYMGRFDPQYDRERIQDVGETLVGLMDERKQIEKYARDATKELIESPFKYQNLAGEIEARDAAARRTWDTDMRRAVPPDFRKDAIIRMGDGGGSQMSVDRFKVVPEMSGWSMGHKMYSADITENGKLIGGLTFSLSPDGIAKIGKISAFKGENAIGFSNLLKLKTELLEKIPGIKGFAGDRVGKHLKNKDLEVFDSEVLKELNY
jgi:hypothetical protein